MFTLLKWNRKEDAGARFIVRDESTKKYSLFTPDHVQDVVWVNQDLTKLPEYQGWDDFDNTQVDYLENVVM